MSRDDLYKGRYSQTGQIYHVTLATNQRRKWFSDLYNARILISHMRRLHHDGLVGSLTWVVMPDHLHWLFELGDELPLQDVVKQLKARSALDINKALGRKGSIWQRGFHDHALRKEEDIRGIARYIVANPLRAGLVEKIGDYPFWDAVWLNVGE